MRVWNRNVELLFGAGLLFVAGGAAAGAVAAVVVVLLVVVGGVARVPPCSRIILENCPHSSPVNSRASLSTRCTAIRVRSRFGNRKTPARGAVAAEADSVNLARDNSNVGS